MKEETSVGGSPLPPAEEVATTEMLQPRELTIDDIRKQREDERNRRIYYQDIVYATCDALDRIFKRSVVRGEAVVETLKRVESTYRAMEKVIEHCHRIIDEHLGFPNDGTTSTEPLDHRLSHLLESVIADEQKRWQDAIDEIVFQHYPDRDGSGAGDPLDLTLLEITQAFGAKDDEVASLSKEFDDYLRGLASSVGIADEVIDAPPDHVNKRLRWAALIQLRINKLQSAAKTLSRLSTAAGTEDVDEQVRMLEAARLPRDTELARLRSVMSSDELTAELRACGITEEQQQRAWKRMEALLEQRREAAQSAAAEEAK